MLIALSFSFSSTIFLRYFLPSCHSSLSLVVVVVLLFVVVVDVVVLVQWMHRRLLLCSMPSPLFLALHSNRFVLLWLVSVCVYVQRQGMTDRNGFAYGTGRRDAADDKE